MISSRAITFALLTSAAVAFSRTRMEGFTAIHEDGLVHIQSIPPPQGAGFLPLTPPPFNAAAQLVSTSGNHVFIAPGPRDARGVCPGLNALANHGYLPRNGIASIAQFAEATQKVFGMGPASSPPVAISAERADLNQDLALFLAIYGATLDGNLSQWSIGGLPHTGIGGSHNNYESDSSPLKSDLHQYGSNGKLVMSQFYNLYNMQPNAATANYNLDILRSFRQNRFNESVMKNPVFYFGPLSGTVVSQAAFTFIYRFMANRSQEYPEGILNKAVLKSFMSIQGPEDNLTWLPGHERIPDNWYRRNPLDEYGIVYLNTDIINFQVHEPDVLLPGCNNGKINMLDVKDPLILSHGAYTIEQAVQNPVCFSLEFLRIELPKIAALNTSPLSPLLGSIDNLTSTLQCTPMSQTNTSVLLLCPGFSLYGGPTGSVAPGSIQN